MVYRQISKTNKEYTGEKLSWKVYAKFLLRFSCSVNVGFAKKIMTKKEKEIPKPQTHWKITFDLYTGDEIKIGMMLYYSLLLTIQVHHDHLFHRC